MVAGDPTQRLLTALGRFQRQVNRAEEGAPQDAWCEECMQQLISGIEIALNESWADVKEALTDTARVLQTYEDANMASDCVPFLKDSYEILCLMVGDLIVDNVRSGVMKKWHERYERALDDLGASGLTLVDDESAREARQEAAADSAQHGIDTPDPFVAEAAPSGDGADEGDAFDAFLNDSGDGGTPVDEPAPVEASAEQGGDPFTPGGGDDSPFGEPPASLSGQDLGTLPSLDSFLEDEGTENDIALTNDFTAEGPAEPLEAHEGIGDNPFADSVPAEEAAPSPTELEPDGAHDHAVDDGPATVEETAPLELDLSGEVDAGDSLASEGSEDGPMDAPVAMEPEVVPAPEPEPEPEPEPVAPAPEPEPEPGSPQALLKTAQEAMASGNVADAKVFALQLAANMARLEAEQVSTRAAAIQSEIDANIEAVAAAEQTVSDAEERLRHLETQIGQFQQDYDGKREEVQRIRDEVAGVEDAVADLDRQIAELEARRDEERSRLAERQSHLDDLVTEESRMQAELDSLNEEEGGARENLDSARERVRALQEDGGSRTAELEAARNELAEREKAVEDIEKTIGHVGGAASDEGGDGQPADGVDDDGASE
jgi:predicted  nucleic acid-binding Zn-ribbon protein